jgi:hypothetical protein
MVANWDDVSPRLGSTGSSAAGRAGACGVVRVGTEPLQASARQAVPAAHPELPSSATSFLGLRSLSWAEKTPWEAALSASQSAYDSHIASEMSRTT